ncbi:hypothetical protein CVIRNUC_009122 [Coccomyxa viridis]|uniref:Uncharacterized protein n=1 Tax=Coccomyxa viridis TaxID=1274662 RepID=A0AAV1IEX7_9CHLO|nr:hypothetical protein CVIRNUC_009122 [Coccomyxa viridis]
MWTIRGGPAAYQTLLRERILRRQCDIPRLDFHRAALAYLRGVLQQSFRRTGLECARYCHSLVQTAMASEASEAS